MGMSANEIAAKAVTLRNGVTVLNVVKDHELTFLHEDGSVESVPFCGWAVTAQSVEVRVSNDGAVAFVTTRFERDQVVAKLLMDVYYILPNECAIVGSEVAAKAYRNRIVTGIKTASDRNRAYLIYPGKFTTFEEVD